MKLSQRLIKIFENPQLFVHDLSWWFLLFANLFTIFLATIEKWHILEVMFIYWFQSVIIGFFNFIKMRSKISVAFFFLCHYGGFHFVYFIFLISGLFGSFSQIITNAQLISLNIGVFFASSMFTFFYDREWNSRNQSIVKVMISPYGRIVPMHLTILLNAFLGQSAIFFFLALKTVVDAIMYSVIKHATIGFPNE